MVLEIDVEGARQVLDRCEDVVCILLVPPSEEAQAARIRARGDSEERVAQRLELGRRETALGRALARYVVVNDDLERTVAEIEQLIARERAVRAEDRVEDGVPARREGERGAV